MEATWPSDLHILCIVCLFHIQSTYFMRVDILCQSHVPTYVHEIWAENVTDIPNILHKCYLSFKTTNSDVSWYIYFRRRWTAHSYWPPNSVSVSLAICVKAGTLRGTLCLLSSAFWWTSLSGISGCSQMTWVFSVSGQYRAWSKWCLLTVHCDGIGSIYLNRINDYMSEYMSDEPPRPGFSWYDGRS